MTQLMTLDEVARVLQLPVKTLRNWRADGRGPRAFRVGRHVRFHPSDVEEWVAAQRELTLW
jgi:excisionase family DNA binding protein